MQSNLYSYVNLVTGSTMLALFLVLTFLRVPDRREWKHFLLAKRLIALACLVLSVNNLVSFIFHVDDERGEGGFLLPLITLGVAAYQALLFTSTSIMMVTPFVIRWRRALVSLFWITVISSLAITLFVKLPAWRENIVILGCVLYTGYITFLTLFFNRHFHKAVLRLEEVYDDDLLSRLRWVRIFFYGALAVGCAALMVAVFPYPSVYNVFKISVPVYYTYVVIQLVNYVPSAAFVVKTFPKQLDDDLSTESPLPEISLLPEQQAETNEVAGALDVWVANRRYALGDATVDEIITELGVSKVAFTTYFKCVLRTQFRTWRRELRIREAVRLFGSDDQLTIADVMQSVGYNDRSNFYKDFQQITGKSLRAYREQMQK